MRHVSALTAQAQLPLVIQGAAKHVLKSLESAIQVAKDRDLSLDSLLIQRIFVDEGSAMKRTMMHSRGRSSMIMKKSSHLTIVLKGEPAGKPAKAAKAKVEEPVAEAVAEEK